MSETNNQTRIIHQLIIQQLEHPEADMVTPLVAYVNSTDDPHTELLVIAVGAIFQHADHLRAFHGTQDALNISRQALEIIDLEDAFEGGTARQTGELYTPRTHAQSGPVIARNPSEASVTESDARSTK